MHQPPVAWPCWPQARPPGSPRTKKLDALVLADRSPEDEAVLGIATRARDEPVRVSDALGRDQDPFRVHPVEDVAEPLPLLADEVVERDLEVVEEDLVGLMVHHRRDRPDRQPRRFARVVEIDEE